MLFVFVINAILVSAQEEGEIKVMPQSYEHVHQNPLMGFTTRGINDHPWPITAHTYIGWNQLENNQSDGIDILFLNWVFLAEKFKMEYLYDANGQNCIIN